MGTKRVEVHCVLAFDVNNDHGGDAVQVALAQIPDLATWFDSLATTTVLGDGEMKLRHSNYLEVHGPQGIDRIAFSTHGRSVRVLRRDIVGEGSDVDR